MIGTAMLVGRGHCWTGGMSRSRLRSQVVRSFEGSYVELEDAYIEEPTWVGGLTREKLCLDCGAR